VERQPLSVFFIFLVFANSAAKVDRPKEMESDPRRKKNPEKRKAHLDLMRYWTEVGKGTRRPFLWHMAAKLQ